MRSNLSFENFAAVLAALGASATIACAGETPQPVHANEVTPGASKTAGQASCSANGCSGNAGAKSDTPAAAPSNAAAPPTTAASPTTPSAALAPASTAATAGSAAPATTSANAVGGDSHRRRADAKKAAAPKPGKEGEASCGAGTCSGDMKKKIL